jgi:hypothetical protein
LNRAEVLPGEETVKDFACTTSSDDFTLELSPNYIHFTGFSRVCLRIATTPAQPNAPFSASVTGPPGGVSGSGEQQGTLDAQGVASIVNDIFLYGTYSWSAQVGDKSATTTVSVTAAQGTCGG